ncbi:MAG: hypothetical protein DMF91_20655 [Acidobacteria bacterium]|nr:MAG: hypothetical protein DMF91_20655 [Acidobacteriota bacterium]
MRARREHRQIGIEHDRDQQNDPHRRLERSRPPGLDDRRDPAQDRNEELAGNRDDADVEPQRFRDAERAPQQRCVRERRFPRHVIDRVRIVSAEKPANGLSRDHEHVRPPRVGRIPEDQIDPPFDADEKHTHRGQRHRDRLRAAKCACRRRRDRPVSPSSDDD